MKLRSLLLAAGLTPVLAWGAVAQQNQASSSQGLPEACQAAAQSGETQKMQGMMPNMGDMQGKMDGMSDAQKAYMQAMMKMQAPMMMAITAKDPDVEFVCGMIPHHQGAIDMARIVLKYGDDPQAKTFAEKVIKEQEAEIREFTAWAEKHANKP